MKTLTTLIAVIGLGLTFNAYATDHHAAQALEHSAVAATHGEEGHAKIVVEHAKAAEKEHAEAHKHSTEALSEFHLYAEMIVNAEKKVASNLKTLKELAKSDYETCLKT